MPNARFAKAKVFVKPLETGDISVELEKLSRCPEVFSKRTIDACIQGAYLLRRLREVSFSHASATELVKELKDMLAKQGDG